MFVFRHVTLKTSMQASPASDRLAFQRLLLAVALSSVLACHNFYGLRCSLVREDMFWKTLCSPNGDKQAKTPRTVWRRHFTDVPLLREDRPHSQYPQKKIRKRVQKFYETIHGKHTTDTHRWHDSHHPVKKKRYSKIARKLCLEVRVPGLWCLSDTTRHLDRLFCLFWYVFEWKSWVKTPSSRRRPPSRSLSWKDLTA